MDPMTKTEMIQELRSLTQAGMADCKAAIEHSQGDLQKAVDYLKTKNLTIADARAGRAASEGMVFILMDEREGYPHETAMVEVNCQTDFVAQNPKFTDFGNFVADKILYTAAKAQTFTTDMVEEERRQVVFSTKENVVVRRWWVEQLGDPSARTFVYSHNAKIGVLVTMLAPNLQAANDPNFVGLGENLAMQIAAMSPLAVDAEHISSEELERQTNIFQTQLQELNKPQATWPKILEGKFRKWYSEVCLMN